MQLSLFVGFFCVACTSPAPVQPEEEHPSVTPSGRVLVQPGQLTLEKVGEGIVLAWEDLSTLEEGYHVSRKRLPGKKTDDFYLPANTTSWTDTDLRAGTTEYTVRAYWHTERSAGATIRYTEYAAPEVSFFPVEASWRMISSGVKVLADGGDAVSFGVTLSREDGTLVQEVTYAEKLSSGGVAYLLFEDLDAQVGYALRPWVENAGGKVYGHVQQARLSAQPDPVILSWEDVLAETVPEGVELKKSTTEELGHTVNLWCAMADLGYGTVEVRTTLSSTLVTPGAYIRETLSKEGQVIALTNGGYFASPAMSYSYVCDRGNKKASNVSQLTRTRGYTVTRGFWGVDSANQCTVGWQSGDNFYSAPLPVYDGGPILYPEKRLPLMQDWTSYNAIGGGPVLVKDGKYCFDYLKTASGAYLSNHELFLSDIYASGLRAPRTAVGSNADGLVVLLVADGRGSGGSTGLTLDEVARIMTGLGCTDVLNLDGGGSSMFLTGSEGILHNHPSDGQERRVMTFISFMAK